MCKVLLITVSALLFAAGCNSQQKEISKDVEYDVFLGKANELFEAKEYKKAKQLAEYVLVDDQYNDEAGNLYLKITRKMYESDSGTDLFGVARAEDEALGEIYTKLKIIIPKIRFENVSLDEAVSFLKMRTRELDPKREGLNILVSLAEVGEDELANDSLDAFDDFDDKPDNSTEKGLGKVINLDADDMPAAEVIKYICDQLGIIYKLEEYAVILTDQHYWGELETRFYAVSDAFVEASRVQGEINFERAFMKIGMSFPPGAKLKYVESAKRLVMTNTSKNHIKLQYFIKVFE